MNGPPEVRPKFVPPWYYTKTKQKKLTFSLYRAQVICSSWRNYCLPCSSCEHFHLSGKNEQQSKLHPLLVYAGLCLQKFWTYKKKEEWLDCQWTTRYYKGHILLPSRPVLSPYLWFISCIRCEFVTVKAIAGTNLQKLIREIHQDQAHIQFKVCRDLVSHIWI